MLKRLDSTKYLTLILLMGGGVFFAACGAVAQFVLKVPALAMANIGGVIFVVAGLSAWRKIPDDVWEMVTKK